MIYLLFFKVYALAIYTFLNSLEPLQKPNLTVRSNHFLTNASTFFNFRWQIFKRKYPFCRLAFTFRFKAVHPGFVTCLNIIAPMIPHHQILLLLYDTTLQATVFGLSVINPLRLTCPNFHNFTDVVVYQTPF